MTTTDGNSGGGPNAFHYVDCTDIAQFTYHLCGLVLTAFAGTHAGFYAGHIVSPLLHVAARCFQAAQQPEATRVRVLVQMSLEVTTIVSLPQPARYILGASKDIS